LKTQTKNLGRALGWLTLMFLAVILYLGLWPYNFGSPAGTHGGAGLQATHWMVLPPNEVEWLKNEPGLRAKFFERIGTRVLDLEKIAMKNLLTDASMDAFIAREETSAVEVLDLLFRTKNVSPNLNGTAFQTLANRLLAVSDEKGVNMMDTHDFLAQPKDVAGVLKEFHAITYRITTNTYHFTSPAFKTAAKQWFQKNT